MADDLTTPLGAGPPGPRRRRRLSILTPLALAVVVALGAIALWIAVVNHPLGGEPSAVAAIAREAPPAGATPADAGAAAAAAAAAAIAPSGDGPLIIKVPRAATAAACRRRPRPPRELEIRPAAAGRRRRPSAGGRLRPAAPGGRGG